MRVFRILAITLWYLIVTRSLAYGQNPIDVTLPNTSADENASVTIPIQAGDLTDRNVISYQTVITFDENILDATGASSTGTLTESFGAPNVNVSIDGEINVGGFGTSPIGGSGTLVNLIFDVVGQPGGMTNIDFSSFIFNSGIPSVDTHSGTFVVNDAVPVELISFTAELTGNSVTLTWMTASETNNWGFEVEKSEDGETFAKIGFVAGSGTTTIQQNYIFHDRIIGSETAFYRLKQIDTDGSFEYSGIIRMDGGLPEAYILEQNFPNPFNPETQIRYELPVSSIVTLTIFDLGGKEVRNLLKGEHKTPGYYSMAWDGRNNSGKLVGSGSFFYSISARPEQPNQTTYFRSKKMTLLR